MMRVQPSRMVHRKAAILPRILVALAGGE